MATAFEGGLLIIALLLGQLLSIDPLANVHPDKNALFLGVIGTCPLLIFFALSNQLDATREVRRFLIEKLGGLLAACTAVELIYLSLLAGATEEVLFRGLLQPWLEADWGGMGGLLFSNMIFALLHWITPMYALLAGVCGIYLGFLLDFGQERNLISPILAHALYDLIAFFVVAHAWRREQSA